MASGGSWSGNDGGTVASTDRLCGDSEGVLRSLYERAAERYAEDPPNPRASG